MSNTSAKINSPPNGTSVVSSLQEKLKNSPLGNVSKSTGVVVLVLIVIVVIVLILIYMYRTFTNSGLKQIDLLDKIISLEQRSNLPVTIPGNKMSVTTRGQEFTYTFWLYLHDTYENTVDHKLLFTRGNTTQSVTAMDSNANPVIMLDRATNTLYVALSTTATPQTNSMTLNAITTPNSGANYLVGKIDYVPLQRWVHITVVVRDGSLQVFMDGDLYGIMSTTDIPSIGVARPMIKGTAGDGMVGNPNTPIKGFMGKLQFFNYAISSKQIQSIYKAGPVNKSMLSYFGLGNYGLRTPIYSIE